MRSPFSVHIHPLFSPFLSLSANWRIVSGICCCVFFPIEPYLAGHFHRKWRTRRCCRWASFASLFSTLKMCPDVKVCVCVCVCVLMRIMFISPPPVFQHRLRCRLCRCLVSHCLAQSFLTGRYWTLHVCLWHIISLYPRFHRYRLIVRLSLFLPLNVLLSTDHCSLTAQLLFCQKRGTRWKGRKTAQSVEKLRQRRRRRRILPQNRPRCAFCRRCCCCSCKWKCMCSM